MANNQVVIYSNGIADFQRCYAVGTAEPKRISIPVRQDHLADVLASFNVYGNVTLDSPPTYRPSNEMEGNISIQPDRVLEDLAVSLSGAQIRLVRASGTLEGTLVGLHEEAEGTAGSPIKPKSLIVLAADGLRRTPIREVEAFEFLDEDVQKEIEKALRRNYQRIKPNSTFVELVLSASEENAEAVVQYTIPAAAWKISYRLRVAESGKMELQGFAIVDNNTDEDWNDFKISVITGEPITFSTDLAESKAPARKHVDLVSEIALGAVEVEASAIVMDGMAAEPETRLSQKKRGRMFMRQSAPTISRSTGPAPATAATMTSAEIHEVGDFSVFESESAVTIPAKRSTVIPVFTVALDQSKSVLHYRHSDHETRPYRAIDFRNEADFSLGRGVCTVFEQSLYSGNCIVPPLKPGESRFLPHALETGVSVYCKPKRQSKKVVALRLSEGFCYRNIRQQRETQYHIKNSRDAAFEMALDHEESLKDPNREAHLTVDGHGEPIEEAAKLNKAVRYSFSLPPHGEAILTVSEERIERSEVELVRSGKQDGEEVIDVNWIRQNLVATNGPLAGNAGIRQCLAIQAECDAKKQEIKDTEAEAQRLTKRQERLRENIKSGGQDDLAGRWRRELDEAERAIQSIEEERVPALRNESRTLRSKLKSSLQSLATEWTDEAESKA